MIMLSVYNLSPNANFAVQYLYMKQVKTLGDVDAILADKFMAPGVTRQKYTLDRMRALMDALGNPQNDIKTVHVAGTSGKTSTCYYTAALLEATGSKVGLTVSPHIDRVNERVQINLKPLTEQKFCNYFNEFLTIPEVTSLQPSYFEVMVAFAFWVFAKEKVDYAVVEVGLGGLLDGTNVIDRPDKVCVITDIGLDHVQVLGDTLTKIAKQKAGIIQNHNTVFMMQQDHAVVDVVEDAAEHKQAALHVLHPQNPGFLRHLPPFAVRNWQLAKAAFDYICERDALQQPALEALTRSAKITVPARMEVVSYKGKTVVLDGSHNEQKLGALREGLAQRFPGKDMAFLVSFIQNRAEILDSAVQAIAPAMHRVVVTEFSSQQDMQHNSLSAITLQAAFKKRGVTEVSTADSPAQAFHDLLNGPEPIIVVTGSFYLLNHIRPEVKA